MIRNEWVPTRLSVTKLTTGAQMKDLLLREHCRHDRARKMGALVALLALIGLVVVPTFLGSPAEQPVRVALFEPVRPNVSVP